MPPVIAWLSPPRRWVVTYPVSRQVSVESLRTCLKGQDAAIARVLDSLPLKWHLRICYCTVTTLMVSSRKHFLSEFAVEFSQYANICSFDSLLPDLEYVVFVCDSPSEVHRQRSLLPVTPIPPNAQPVSKFIHYGNEAQAGKLYADICLVAVAPVKFHDREQQGQWAEEVEAHKEDLRFGYDSDGSDGNSDNFDDDSD
ncbi:hypothetical protein BS17DRAFT_818245 [Gyrodon lividus]|nr:hypothetical protein BS17DRAFT_818245 [Gyrodon lividus]